MDKTVWSWLAAFVCCISTFSMHSESFSWQHIQQQAQHAVVQVVNHSVQIDDLAPFRRGGAEGRGSGFIIEGGYVVTNFHVNL